MPEAHLENTTEPPVSTPALLTVQNIAAMLNCSSRHIYRLMDSQRIPQPVKLGALLRWVKADVDQWIANGCPDCRKGNRR